MKKLEKYFESFLWNSRLVVIAAVVASLAAAVAVFYLVTVDVWYLLTYLWDYASPKLSADEREALHAFTIRHVVVLLDGYLLASVLLIFALGLYELFISRINQAADSETGSKILLITDLDDLKARVGKVVLLILIVKFFERALSMHFSTPTDMLYFAGSIALVGLALYLSHTSGENKKSAERGDGDR